MKKATLSIFLFVLMAHYSLAQTKIFKQVGNEISSKVETIRQGNTLVGYLVFTLIEQATKDSFSYRITIMDENLNDIGTVNFREVRLELQAVSFEQDVLCLGYFKSNFIGYAFNGKKEHQAAMANNRTEVFTQFIGLDGKIKKTNSVPVSVEISLADFKSYGDMFAGRREVVGSLNNKIRLKNIPQKGFACFFGDNTNKLIVYSLAGDIIWQKKVITTVSTKSTPWGDVVNMLTSGNDIYILTKKEMFTPGGYSLLGYSLTDTAAELKYSLVDAESNGLNLFSFENDPVTGYPYIASLTLNKKHDGYMGMCTVNIDGIGTKAINAVYTYWDKNPLDSTNDARLFEKEIKKTALSHMFKGFDGLTYIVASNKINGAELIKQNGEGKLSIETNVLGEKIGVYSPGPGFPRFGNDFYHLVNTETKTDYLVADVPQMITIYDVTHKKIVRSILHKEAGILTGVLPAKEGYIMVSEYNKKEKYTKVSIEAL